jgi:hypothetical protein
LSCVVFMTRGVGVQLIPLLSVRYPLLFLYYCATSFPGPRVHTVVDRTHPIEEKKSRQASPVTVSNKLV